jgi:DNA repair photolyase
VLVAPLMPGINDAPEQLAPILEMASEAGAAYVTGIPLHLRGDVRGLFFDWLRANRPNLVARYKRLYRKGAYADPDERARLTALLKGPEAPPGWRMRGNTQARRLPDRQDLAINGNSSQTPRQGRLF